MCGAAGTKGLLGLRRTLRVPGVERQAEDFAGWTQAGAQGGRPGRVGLGLVRVRGRLYLLYFKLPGVNEVTLPILRLRRYRTGLLQSR